LAGRIAEGAQNVARKGLIIPDEIHELLRWSDWIRAYRATAEFFDLQDWLPLANGNKRGPGLRTSGLVHLAINIALGAR
jgi:hypothetical protein